ncbi:hypothetical protein ACVMAJ_007447 [Bradyrhizobium sp. USDA 4448]
MDSIADDLLRGIKSISRFTGDTERQAFYLAEKGRIPGVWKDGGRYFGLKSKIREGYQKRASGVEVA